MRWSIDGAHRLLQTRVAMLDHRLETHFYAHFPHFRSPDVHASRAAHSPNLYPLPSILFFDTKLFHIYFRRQNQKGLALIHSTVNAPNLVVRPVVDADFTAWMPLWDDYNAFYGRSGPTALPEEVTRVTWARFIEEAEPVHALVAERAGRLLGLVHFLYHRSTSQIAMNCYLQDLFTNLDARGTGVGRQLIQAVYVRARAAGAGRVYWLTHHTNTTARRLYDQVAEDSGFVMYRKML
jgi:GNAT superfamily N-acetyltransferase